jgi:DNA polymerase-1
VTTIPDPLPEHADPQVRIVGRRGDDSIRIVDLDDSGAEVRSQVLDRTDLADTVRDSPPRLRWVWSDTTRWYPPLLEVGVRVERCHDLRLVHAILVLSELVEDPVSLRAATAWRSTPAVVTEPRVPEATLFDLDPEGTSVPDDIDEALAEFHRQQEAIARSRGNGRLQLLAAAESAGSLIAEEMHAAGLPWDTVEHDRILREDLGPRPRPGEPPQLLAEVAAEVRSALGDPLLSLDSQPKLLRALHRAGIDVESTSRWELEGRDHPAIGPLLRYKKLARLLSANGWVWMDEWVHEGRYRPVYVPGGVVTGRWASSGGGALQIPRRLRPALRADAGWLLVDADVSQLEPRVLAAMAGDRAMARAGAGQDLYAGIVESGVVPTRQEAKVAVLGALYGGTTGDSGRLVPRLRQTFTRAMELVDHAAETGERGGTVSTWLGRSSPEPDPAWLRLRTEAALPDAAPGLEQRARRSARDRGRFTRNFVVQGSAAEWALAWMALLRLRLAEMGPVADSNGSGPDASPTLASASGPAFAERPHLAFFLHDEVIVHTPADRAEEVARAVQEAADAAGALLFPGCEVDFPLDVQISERSQK